MVAVQPGKYMYENSISVVVYYRTQVQKKIQEPVNLDDTALYVIGRIFENSNFFRAGLKKPQSFNTSYDKP